MKLTQDIQPRGMYSAYVESPFDIGKKDLEKAGYKIISLEENTLLRIKEGKDSFVSKNGNYTRECFIYNPQTKLWYLTNKSPIMENPVKATNAHRKGKEYYLTDNQVQASLEGSVEVTNESIPTNRFGEECLTIYAFGDNAKDYGLFLQDADIEKMPIWLSNSREKPFARQMWFSGLDYLSVLFGNGRFLDCDYWLRGVRDA